MSHGPGRLQRAILDILAVGGPLTTGEIADWLTRDDPPPTPKERKQTVAKVLRSCHSLFRRGLIHGQHAEDSSNRPTYRYWIPGARTVD
jgi:predicted transcriptional regulator